ncbi:putative Elicitor-responsive protein [Hibiscus syriacus]|uniref:Elicitor-responsive protein n=1 Tax=Hibiscus syriacus TaxID=106335 RepID=A0A6A2YES7_HIBSY|nr:putative Elicitor-responsive protein [Hibiscus syriacus]
MWEFDAVVDGTLSMLSECCQIRNECSYTVWAAASPGGGRRLVPFQSGTINMPAGTPTAHIWGRTNCNIDGSVDGFNIPMVFGPTSGGCHNIRGIADIDGQSPSVLRAPGGCNNPCSV